jgi:hypothetical protein
MGSRQRRGRESELIAERWFRDNGWSYATATPGSAGGVDLIHTDPFAVEVKATANLSIPAFIRQAARNTQPGQTPVLLLRLNGQGPESVENWPIVLPSLAYLAPLAVGLREMGLAGARAHLRAADVPF